MSASAHPFRLILFDFDGTLVDSQHVISKTMASAFRYEGLAAPSAFAVKRVVGLRLEEAISILADEEVDKPLIKRLSTNYRNAFLSQDSGNDYSEPLFEGVIETLAELDRADVCLGIATGKGRRALASSLERHGLQHHFVILKTADDGPGKPDPSILFDAIAEMGVSKDETILVGDTVFDIHMAVNAGIRAIGAGWGYHESAALSKAGADLVLDRITELPRALKFFEGAL